MLWYRTEPLAAYNRGGQYQRVLDLSAPALARTDGVAQIYEQRGFAYVGLGPDRRRRLPSSGWPCSTTRRSRHPREALAKLGQ